MGDLKQFPRTTNVPTGGALFCGWCKRRIGDEPRVVAGNGVSFHVACYFESRPATWSDDPAQIPDRVGNWLALHSDKFLYAFGILAIVFIIVYAAVSGWRVPWTR